MPVSDECQAGPEEQVTMQRRTPGRGSLDGVAVRAEERDSMDHVSCLRSRLGPMEVPTAEYRLLKCFIEDRKWEVNS